MKEYKVVVVGNGGVGKSALTVRFVQGQFVHSYDATIEDSYRKQIQLDGEDCRMEILDTAGTEQFSGMRDLYVRNGQGFMLVYSIDDYASFEPIESLANYILRLKERRVPIVIVGNKCDLDSSRCVPFQKGAELAKRLDCAFYETSAKNNLNVRETFLNCARQIRLDAYGKKGKRQTLRDPNFIQNKQSKEKYEKGCCVTM